jgi:dUTP pyrophosphatase
MKDFSIKIKKLHEDAIVPNFAHDGDAGMDLYSTQTIVIHPGERVSVPTGIAIEMPLGFVSLIWDKSSLSHNQGLKTLGGVVDAGYRGEVFVGIINLGVADYTLKKGHKVAQFLVQKIERPIIEIVEELPDSHRGEGGFGSSGK